MKTIRAGTSYVLFVAIVCGSLCFGSSARAEWKTLREARGNELDGTVQLDVNQEIKSIRITGQSELIWIWELSVKVGNQMLILDEYRQLAKGEKWSPIIPNAPRQVTGIVIRHGDGSFRVEADVVPAARAPVQAKSPPPAPAKPAERQKITERSGRIALGGRWEAFGKSKKIADGEIIQQGDQLEFVVRLPGRPELRAPGRFVDSETARADGWMSSTAKIREGGKRLEWDNGGYWLRVGVPMVSPAPPKSPGADMAALKQLKTVAEEGAPFPDEAAVMAAYQAQPSEDLLEKLITIRAGHGMALCAKSIQAGNPDSYKQGLSYMDSALDLASDNPRLYAMAGMCYAMAAGEDDTAAQVAREYLEYALYLDNTLADAQLMLGSLYFDAGEYVLSVEPFENCIRSMRAMAPADVVGALAEAYGKAYRVDQGMAFFTEMLKSKGAGSVAHLGRAQLLWENKQRQQAVEELRVVLKDEQANEEYRNAAGQLALTWGVAQ